eukprot:1071945-Amphidinium_carterae.5
MALNTWGVQAVTIWQSAVTYAKTQHAQWFSVTPAQRTMHWSLARLPDGSSQSELLTNKILPMTSFNTAEERRYPG